MKIRNIKYFTIMIGMATSISLSGCSKQNNVNTQICLESNVDSIDDAKLQNTNTLMTNTDRQLNSENLSIDSVKYNFEAQNTIKLDMEGEEVELLSNEEIKELVRYLQLRYDKKLKFSYDEKEKFLTIYSSIDIFTNMKLLKEEDYVILNKIVKNCNSMSLSNLSSQIDFSNINLSNIKKMEFHLCYDNFNFEPFKHQNFDSLKIDTIRCKVSSIKDIVLCQSNANICITLSDNYLSNSKAESINFINQMIHDGTKLECVSILMKDLSCDDCMQICKLNTETLYIDNNSFEESNLNISNINLQLNNNIKKLLLNLKSNSSEYQNIQIASENNESCIIYLDFDSKITKNTNIIVPNNSILDITASSIEDTSFIYHLNNISLLIIDSNSTIGTFSMKSNLQDVVTELENFKQKSYKKELQ